MEHQPLDADAYYSSVGRAVMDCLDEDDEGGEVWIHSADCDDTPCTCRPMGLMVLRIESDQE